MPPKHIYTTSTTSTSSSGKGKKSKVNEILDDPDWIRCQRGPPGLLWHRGPLRGQRNKIHHYCLWRNFLAIDWDVNRNCSIHQALSPRKPQRRMARERGAGARWSFGVRITPKDGQWRPCNSFKRLLFPGWQ